MTKEQELLNYIILHSNDDPYSIGLFNGQMGAAIVLYLYSRKKKIPIIEYFADKLIDNIIERSQNNIEFGFSEGVEGIGWGLEFLAINNFANTNEKVLRTFDNKVQERNIIKMQDFSLSNGLLGIWHYISARLFNSKINNTEIIFGNRYILDWIGIINKRPLYFPNNAGFVLKQVLQGFEVRSDLSINDFINIYNLDDYNSIGLNRGASGLLYNFFIK